jgi:hypothetical protein
MPAVVPAIVSPIVPAIMAIMTPVIVAAIMVAASASLPASGRVDPAIRLTSPTRLDVDITLPRVHVVAVTPYVPSTVPLPMPFDPDGVTSRRRRATSPVGTRGRRGLTHDDDTRLAALSG